MTPHLSAFRCVRCGNALELPQDPRLLHVDCPTCGTDNILPSELIYARQQQYQLEMQRQGEAQRLAANVAAQRAASSGRVRTVIVLVVAGFVAIAGFIVLVIWAAGQQEAQMKLAADPKKNGQAALLAHLAALRTSNGCDRILVQPSVTVGTGSESTVSLDMVAGDHCVHVIGISGSQASLTLRYTTPGVALKTPVPPSGAIIDYRLCASETANHAFAFKAVDGSAFTTAAIECPRTAAEGAPRSAENDPSTSGVAKAKAKVDALFKAGCNYVVTQPTVQRGKQTYTFTSKEDSACLNLIVASAYADVKLKLTLSDPENFVLPVPEAASELRAMYCPSKAGKYTFTLEPSTFDHFAQAAVDCPRGGPEGLKREQAQRKPR